MTEKTNSNTGGPKSAAGIHTMDRMAKSAHDGINAASNAAHPAIDNAASGAHRVVDNADEWGNQAAEAFEKASAKSGKMITATTSYLREHPVLTLSLAVGAGYLVSRLLNSR